MATSTTGHSSGISSERTSGISSGISERTSLGEIDASLFDDDISRLRTTTPVETRVPEELWYKHILSEFSSAWNDVDHLWSSEDRRSKLYAVVSFISLPLRALINAASPHNNNTVPNHTSVCYLFLLMCYTFVLNLIEHNGNKRRDTYVAFCMAIAIAAMLYLYLFTKDRVHHDPRHDAPMRIFFRLGMYIFGFATMVNSICLALDEWNCTHVILDEFDNRSAATAQVLKALFVVAETLFLGYFHQACLPLDTAFLQICIAHILGTNLTLWFWTLCEETKTLNNSHCTDQPLNWGRFQKFFYPVFVEYLILALAILYGLWTNLKREDETPCPFCKDCMRCVYRRQNRLPEEENDISRSRRQLYAPRCGFGVMIGTIYVAVFLLMMMLAIVKVDNLNTYGLAELFPKPDKTNIHRITNSSKPDFEGNATFKGYCWASVILYLTMICACYVILTSLRSPRNIERVRSVDYDDVLLYISLMGILLLEGFHLVSKILTYEAPLHVVALDISSTVQHLTQAVTLISLSHYRGATGHRNRTWICECILFLLLANMAWWIEDSFFLEPTLERPGEVFTIKGIATYGAIVKPMVIFFRFHSATYFYNAWTIYRL